jgi:hypothetical protein
VTPDGEAHLAAARRHGNIVIEVDDGDRRVTVFRNDAECGELIRWICPLNRVSATAIA